MKNLILIMILVSAVGCIHDAGRPKLVDSQVDLKDAYKECIDADGNFDADLGDDALDCGNLPR